MNYMGATNDLIPSTGFMNVVNNGSRGSVHEMVYGTRLTCIGRKQMM